MRKIFVFLLLLCAVAAAQMPLPTPPKVYLNTTWNPPSGVTWYPRISADLQNALNSAHPGDTIVLNAGSTYTGNFTLPAKANPYRPVDLHSKLSAEPIARAGRARRT